MGIEPIKEATKPKNRLLKTMIYSKIFSWVAAFAAILLAVILTAWGVSSYFQAQSKTTTLGFENIGELATQSAFCTEVNVIEADRKLFGMTIPFTQSKYIYSYDIEMKAGMDFRKVEWQVDDQTIRVKLPPCEVLSSEIDLDSFQVYHEQESIFKQIHLEENNQALNQMKQQAQADAIENGLLENARSNAEAILRGFFSKAYDLSEYDIVFTE